MEVRKRDAGVGEPVAVDPVPGTDQRLDVPGDVPDVDVHTGHDTVVAQPEGDQLAGLAVAAEDELVLAGREAGAGKNWPPFDANGT